MPGSPTGAYLNAGFTLVQLQAIQQTLLLRITNGDRTSLSGAAKSSGFNFAVDPLTALVEINFAIGRLTNTGPARSTHFDASGQYSCLNSGPISIP